MCGFKVLLFKSSQEKLGENQHWKMGPGSILEHSNCFGTAKPKTRELLSSQTLRVAVTANRGIKAKALTEELISHDGVAVARHTLYRAKNNVLAEDDGSYTYDYQKLKSWEDAWTRNGNGDAELQVDDQNRFVSITVICHAACRRCKRVGQRIVGTDGAHMKHRLFRGQLLAMEGRDGNGKNVLMAFMLCPIENANNYRRFFTIMKGAEVDGELLAEWLDSPLVIYPYLVMSIVFATERYANVILTFVGVIPR